MNGKQKNMQKVTNEEPKKEKKKERKRSLLLSFIDLEGFYLLKALLVVSGNGFLTDSPFSDLSSALLFSCKLLKLLFSQWQRKGALSLLGLFPNNHYPNYEKAFPFRVIYTFQHLVGED